MQNPFELFSYQGPEYFCDRIDEVNELKNSFENRRNLVLFADRRLGKSHLIHHFQYHFNQRKDVMVIYLDVLNTASDQDFINAFVSAIIEKFKKEKSFPNKILQVFQGFSPSLTIDPLTGNPEIRLGIKNNREVGQSIKNAIDLLETSNKLIQIAIDGFQVIETYKA